jgi:hypothetical protein
MPDAGFGNGHAGSFLPMSVAAMSHLPPSGIDAQPIY